MSTGITAETWARLGTAGDGCVRRLTVDLPPAYTQHFFDARAQGATEGPHDPRQRKPGIPVHALRGRKPATTSLSSVVWAALDHTELVGLDAAGRNVKSIGNGFGTMPSDQRQATSTPSSMAFSMSRASTSTMAILAVPPSALV